MVEAPTAETAAPAQRLRLRQGALISAGSALVLLVVMFATKWYGVDEIPGRVATRTQVTHAANAWHALTIVRWLMLATIIVAVGTVLLHGSQRGRVDGANGRWHVTSLGLGDRAICSPYEAHKLRHELLLSEMGSGQK